MFCEFNKEKVVLFVLAFKIFRQDALAILKYVVVIALLVF